MQPAIRFEDVSKRYQIGSGHRSLRKWLSQLSPSFRQNGDGPDTDNELWAVRDVTFSVEPGEVLGIIGHNGAGKTTILKLLSSVTRPNSGIIELNGRLSALIELGAGFHPDLTGRENIYLNATILGMSRKQTDAAFDAIVDFSGLETFLDTPVKRYSSGMYVRLGFAVAIHARPEILLVDEVLAVGDMAFQRKCVDRMLEIRRSGTTIVFVSHNIRTVESLCNRGLWLDHGRVHQIGDLQPIIGAYTDETIRLMNSGHVASVGATVRRGTGEVRITQVRTLNGDGRATSCFRLGQRLELEIGYQTTESVRDPSFDIAIYADNGARVCTATTRMSSQQIEQLGGTGAVHCVFDEIPFTPGGYSVTIAIFDSQDLLMYDQWYRATGFTVESQILGDVAWHLEQEEHGVVYVSPEWLVE